MQYNIQSRLYSSRVLVLSSVLQLEALPCKKEGALSEGNHSVLLLEKELAATSDGASPLSGNKSRLLTARSVSPGGRGVTNVLMVTTTVGMLYRVHGYTSNSGPVSLLGVRSVVGAVGAEHGLVSSLTTGNNADHGSAAALDGLSHTRWHSDTGLLTIFGVADDDSTGARGSGEGATVTHLSLNVRDDGSFWHAVDRDDIADRKGSY